MRKAGYFLAVIVYLFMLLAVGKTSFTSECAGPAGLNCLYCHAAAGGGTSGGCPSPDGYLHQNPPEHKLLYDTHACLTCHCGEAGVSPCAGESWGTVETYCCTSCHGCVEVTAHTNKTYDDCGECHYPPGDPGNCATPIPTLSEWGIIIFMTIIMGIGVLMIIRKRRIA